MRSAIQTSATVIAEIPESASVYGSRNVTANTATTSRTKNTVRKMTGSGMGGIMPHRKFPLPQGHVYAPGIHSKRHDGSLGHEGLWLAHLQQALRLRWGFDK